MFCKLKLPLRGKGFQPIENNVTRNVRRQDLMQHDFKGDKINLHT